MRFEQVDHRPRVELAPELAPLSRVGMRRVRDDGRVEVEPTGDRVVDDGNPAVREAREPVVRDAYDADPALARRQPVRQDVLSKVDQEHGP